MSPTASSAPEVRLPGLHCLEHELAVPLDHAQPAGETIRVFARELRALEPGAEKRPFLVFLQGGPGFASPRPESASGWIGRALREFRVLLLDQRGTGRSTPLDAESVTARGGPEEQARYLACFRMDSIVEDCERLRAHLIGDQRWALLGQSFGGFCSTRYLSAHPEALSLVLITGGLPPLSASAEEIYRRTYRLVDERNRQYYARYPRDVERIGALRQRLRDEDVRLPNGDRLTPRRLQLLGLNFGFKGGYETVHDLIEQAFPAGCEGARLGLPFLKGVEANQAYDTNPIFALLHEGCYTQGAASNWAAERVRAEFARFDPEHEGALWFTGEMIYPWMLEEFGALAPMREAGELIARKADWPALYDPEVLAHNEVPVAAAVYHDDMYVERAYSLETAAAIRGCRVWITNEHEHNGLRADGEGVISHLLDLARGRA